MSSCDPTYLGYQGHRPGAGGRGMRGGGSLEGEVPRGEEAVGSSSSKAGVVWKLGVKGLRNDAFWAGVVRAQRKGSVSAGSHGTSPNLLRLCTPTARRCPHSLMAIPSAFDGSQSHVQCSGRRQLVPPDPKHQGGQAG